MSGLLKRRRTDVAWTMGVLLLVVFVAVAAHHADGRRLAEPLRSAQPAWLGAAAALQVAMRQGRIRNRRANDFQ